ncbi:Uncharacterized protein APZ42_001419 [Daphnia magna]|uniref:Uncharacterized protein n=1 Tax=Daphnia magna TaxID=35525 RepID=A0A162C7N4_9CRUS|nr:Uncharacterized protein APZ42_001419 [Daphnia magna]
MAVATPVFYYSAINKQSNLTSNFNYKAMTRGPHSVQEVPDRVRPSRQFAIISRKPFALPAKQTPYTCPMRRALIINAFIPPSHFCQNRPKTTSHEILQKSDGIIEIER